MHPSPHPPAQGPHGSTAMAGLWRGLLAGAVLALAEFALVLVYARDLFLSVMELIRYLGLAMTAVPAVCGVVALLGAGVLAVLERGARRNEAAYLRQLRLLVMTASVPLCAWTLWLLTTGRRVRDVPGRPVLIAIAALLLAWIAGRVAVALVRAHRAAPRRPGHALAFAAIAVFALAIDAYVLRRLYPAFHTALATIAVLATVCAAPFAPIPRRLVSAAAAGPVAMGCGLLALLSLHSLRDAPNARFAIRETAPLSGKLLRTAARVRSGPQTVRPKPQAARPPVAQHAGIDLRGGDVLFITVDALRADRLRAYGGRGLTPTMDALAKESVVFTRAYTPTPHTSYAISSLFTGKFMQPLLSLAETATGHHPTLPQLLRHHGYRTAAFYPPAIFFVDEERFDWLSRDHLGFEYVKAMFAPADERVTQLERYLAEVAPGHPVFVWIHLFEPHEPYDPPPAFARGDTPEQLYDGEVAAADAAVGKLITTFRAARPDATVILTADHGEEFGDHGGHHHGTTLYDEQVRVPLLWSSPGRARPGESHVPVEIIDVTTTLLAALGIPREARMRGDDLGPMLAGEGGGEDLHAFASIAGARMVSDGRHKLVCQESECQLFDLRNDPGERRDLSHEQPGAVAALREELARFVASLPKLEALPMDGGGAWPEALARARLRDVSAAPELVPLLSADRAEVRAAAARALGELGLASARNVLARMRAVDRDERVRAEAAIAALRLGDLEALESVRALLAGEPEPARRAALALAAHGDGAGEAVLIAAAADRALDERERLAAVQAIAAIGSRLAIATLVPLLDDVRMRADVALALGRIGDRKAVPALARALAAERYPEARAAEARALLTLGARAQALALTRRFLGTETSIPDGVGLLRDAGALAAVSGAGADLTRAPQVRRGEWACEARGCRPIAEAAIVLPRGGPRGPARVTVRVQVEGTSRLLRLAGVVHYLNAGADEIAWTVADGRALVVEAAADAGVWLEAIAVVPVTDDVPPPAPEPHPVAIHPDEARD